jgi:glycosyltransferase involved in cell wall biosynthesis
MSNSLPLVCICVPTYNAQDTIKETLLSIVNQTYRNLRILVVDNASTDSTLNIVTQISDPRISIHRQPHNIGAEGNFNSCIKLANGKYTAIYHADDIYEQSIIERQVEFLEHNLEVGAVFTQAYLINENNIRIGEISVPKPLISGSSIYQFSEIFKAVMQYSNFLICPSAMLRTDIYQVEIKTWRMELFNTSSDLDLWLRVLKNHSIGVIAERLINYRISRRQYSATLRARINRSDFFLVMDHYLAQDSIKKILTTSDYLHYQRLERTDQVLRAVNLYLIGDFRTSLLLSKNLLVMDDIKAAMTSRRGFITLVALSFLRIFVFINRPKIGQFILTKMKSVVGK